MNIHRILRNAFLAATVVISATHATAQDFDRPYSKRDAVVVIDSPASMARAYAKAHQDGIRCGVGQRVGVWLESDDATTIRGVRISGCDVGIVVRGTPVSMAKAGTPGHTVEDVQVEAAIVGAWLRGDHSGLTGGILTDVVYGIVVSGSRNRIDGVRVIGAREDGIMVTGLGNTLVRNVVDGSGGHGVNLVGHIPATAPGVVLNALRELPEGNTLQDNRLIHSGGYDLRQWPAGCRDAWQRNTFLRNTAPKRSAWCLRELSPPEE